ncbi:MAG: aminoacetone oxidase family FAD-binding enzyme, partial [Phycisphaerae bacterium]|nr:aminoacetone oxidase family FAD-binding enzyme [Phycisphaerae bacterium]
MAERSSVERRDAGEGADADRGADLAVDLAVIGAGAAGLFASIWAARTNPRVRVIALDGARKLGAKILVAGGGRCNVTHHAVSERDFSGSTPAAIRRVLERFGVAQVVEYFGSLGVALTREQTGKLFPTTDDARTILNALLDDARNHGVTLMHPARVRAVRARAGASDSNEFARFELETDIGRVAAKRIILAAGGRALPKSGSDGAGFDLARSLGHSLSERITPALVPLLLADGHWIRTIPGVAADAEVVVRDGGRIVRRDRGSVLCTHFGLSGPAVLDASRHLLNAIDGTLSVRWLPGVPDDRLDAWLRAPEAPTIG